jgi:hypothetical protein
LAAEDPAGLLRDGGRRAAREAEAVVRRGDVCELLPGLHAALAAGVVTAGHADPVGRVAADLDEAGRATLCELENTIVTAAAERSVEVFQREMSALADTLAGDDGTSRHERRRRQRCVKRWVDRQTGLCHTHLTLDPEADAAVGAALGAAVYAEQQTTPDDDDRSFDQVRADVMVELITGARSVQRRTPQVSVLIDYDTLRDRIHDRGVCETDTGEPLPPSAVRRLACDAEVVPVTLNGHGVVLDEGRARRTATAEQRRALRAMHRSCVHPDCTVGFEHCDIHHVTPWWDGGRSDLENMAPVCSRHHHLVHDTNWSLTLHPDRTVEWRRPDGTIHHKATSVSVAPHGVYAELQALMGEVLDHAMRRLAAPPSRAPAA